jgi:diguanylate cyclase (GGDEF)-like protein
MKSRRQHFLHRKIHGLTVLLLGTFFLASPWLAGAAVKAESAKEPPTQLRTLTTTREAHSLSSKEAARVYPIHLRGVVTYYDPKEGPKRTVLFVHDATGSIFVELAQGLFESLPAGSLIDLRGVSNPGEFAPIVAQPQIKVIGYSSLPADPDRPSLAHLMSGAEDGQWVEVEGVVHSVVEDDRHVSLQLTLADGSITAFMMKEAGAKYSGLVDAKIRIRGNASPLFDISRRQMIGVRLHCPNLSTVTIVEPPPADPFNLSTIPVYLLLQWDVVPLLAHRVHVQGRVSLQWPGSLVCLRDAPQGICAQTDQGTRLRNGELIDIAGFASAEGGGPVLTDAVFRSAGSGLAAPVPAVPVVAEQALTGKYESQLIQIDGQLVSRDLASADTTLLLTSGKSIFTAILPQGLGGPQADAWKNGSVLRITGICRVQLDAQRSRLGIGTAVPRTFRVLMRSPADVVVVQKPSWWTPVHAVMVLTLALTGTLLVLGWVVVLRKRIRESEERFRHMAQHDALTGLATRLVLQDRLSVALEAAKRHRNGLALLMLDIDKFKLINDTFGHHAGDEVLRVTAERIVQAVRKTDTVARMGGDEFVVLLTDLTDQRAAENIAAKVVAALAVPVPLADSKLPVSVSVGVCSASAGELDADVLLRNVDAALYRAKAKGRNCFEVFTPEIAEV